MSGKWSNAKNILKNRHLFKGLNIIWIFSDNTNSNAQKIWIEFNIPTYIMHIDAFTEKNQRIQYFQNVSSLLESLEINILIYAWFMKIVPDFFTKKFLGINSHPADLSIKDSNNLPKYVGMNAIKKIIEANEKSICCSCCIVDVPVDTGIILWKSRYISIKNQNINDIENIHEALKKEEHKYYPKIIQKLCIGENLSQ